MTKDKYYWLNKDSRKFLERGYLLPGETPEERIIAMGAYAGYLSAMPDLLRKFESYMAQGFYSLSSPIWANFGRRRGLPISCFGSYVEDSIESILNKVAEVGVMTKHAGGTSAYFGEVRPRGDAISSGGASTGVVHFMELFDKLMTVVSQGNVRRGSFAAYLPIDHGDIEEFLRIKSEGNSIQDLSFAVTVSDDWMKTMLAGDKAKRKLWGQVIKRRFESGYPYIFFTDNVNNNTADVYKDKGLKIHASNLCSEIMLPSSHDESFVCDLSSMNLERWEDWKDTDAVEVLVYFLDAVMSEFIDKTNNKQFMAAPNRFARRHRALGVGVLGWHSLLQSKMIAFESMEAKLLNTLIWKTIQSQSLEASKKLAKSLGEPELLKGYGRRNTTLLAVAPTTSSSFILGQVSPSIEPMPSNYYIKDLAKGKFTYKNPYLKKLLKDKELDTEEIWASILVNGGSVQHLQELTEDEKNVFKTFEEISQKEIVIQAAQRQKYIDQGQSLNLMIPHDASPKDVNTLLLFGWEQGIKTFYYQRSSNPSQKLARSILSCKSCEG
jgi:ribonucleoside-diphosphate reductase alpha chain